MIAISGKHLRHELYDLHCKEFEQLADAAKRSYPLADQDDLKQLILIRCWKFCSGLQEKGLQLKSPIALFRHVAKFVIADYIGTKKQKELFVSIEGNRSFVEKSLISIEDPLDGVSAEEMLFDIIKSLPRKDKLELLTYLTEENTQTKEIKRILHNLRRSKLIKQILESLN